MVMTMKVDVFYDAVRHNLLDFSEVLTVFMITLMMKAVSTSETLDSIYQTTRCNIAEDSHLATCYCAGQSSAGACPIKTIMVAEVNALFCLFSTTSHTTARLMGTTKWDSDDDGSL
jgi:hypothetical protein